MGDLLEGTQCVSCKFSTIDKYSYCPNCGSKSFNEVKFIGEGFIFTYTVVMVGFGKMASRVPYILATVELKEGLKLVSILEDMDIQKVRIGDRVKLKRIEDETGPIFQPMEI